jgi:hypothetical protein
VLLTDRYNRLALSWWPKGAERQLPDHVLEVLEALCEAQWGQVPSSENRVFTCERLRDPQAQREHAATSVIGTTRTSRNVRCSVAIRGKADIEQAAVSKLDL